VTLVERLIGKGLKLAIYDRDVELARLFGANKEFIENEIPHISSLMRKELQEVIEFAEVIVIGKRDEEFRAAAASNGRAVIDLVRMIDREEAGANYQGICW
jgi:GDP-mannose 6-dehydrogenase